jgi:hypothetical protein
MLLPTMSSVSAMARFGSQVISRMRRVVDGNSLQTRLTIGVVLTSLLGIGTMALWMGWRMQQILMQEQKQRTALVADRLQEDARYYATMMPPAEALQRVIDYRTTSDVAIWVEAETGQMVMQSETLKMGSWQKSGVTDELLVASLQPGLQLVPIQGWQLVVCARPPGGAGDASGHGLCGNRYHGGLPELWQPGAPVVAHQSDHGGAVGDRLRRLYSPDPEPHSQP